MTNLTCETCGGGDFFNQEGFYYCSECNTQIAGLQEQEYEELNQTYVNKTRKVKSSNSSKTENRSDQITSWECYNYILLGLVNELIELGAHENLKLITQTIWFQYLKKTEVIHKNVAKPPYLPAYNYKHNAKIIYGRCKKKTVYKRKRSISSSSTASALDTDSTISKKEQNRLKRAMAKAIYDSQQIQNSQQSESSLLNQSLSSLKSNSSDVPKHKFLNFSKAAKVELEKHMSKEHLQEHIEDVNVDLNCHNASYRSVSCSYRKSCNIMTQTKMYAMLYLALLINKDDIQLGDMLRFINEGNLSYNNYQHFFPEDIDPQASFLNEFKVNKGARHETYRVEAAKLAMFLGISEDIPTPNIVKLITRYCRELNLPEAVTEMCINFIASTQPRMKIQNNVIPNYEAKAMCVIIFVLKLLFGLDDVTELHISSFAKLINMQDGANNMFNFMEWLETILYRRSIIAKHHFIVGYNEKIYSISDYIRFINSYYTKYDIKINNDQDYDNINHILFNKIDLDQMPLYHNASLTFMQDIIKQLSVSGKLGRYKDVLMRNYELSSLSFISNSHNFLSKETEIFNGGAHNNVYVVPLYHVPVLKKANEVTCKLSNYTHINMRSNEIELPLIQQNIDHFYFCNPKHKVVVCDKNALPTQAYSKHYKPDRMYWGRLGVNIANMAIDEFETFWKSFPYQYRLVVSECAKICGQDIHQLVLEFNYFDSYVSYHHLFEDSCKRKKLRRRNNNLNTSLMRLVKNAMQNW